MSPSEGKLVRLARTLFETGVLSENYDVVRTLGEGGMGVVFLAIQKGLERKVAIKCVVRDLFGDSVNVERFRREANVLSRLHHPGLIQLYTVGDTESLVYIVSEYVEAEDLRTRLQSGTLSLGEVCRIIIDVAKALEYVHEKNIVHRDIKPENILLPKDGTGVRLIDFGLARDYSDKKSRDQLTRMGQVVGTPIYMAPEVARGDAFDPRTDIYSLAVVLFEMLTGRPPFRGSPLEILRAHLEKKVPSVRAYRPELSAGFDKLFFAALAKDPNKRFAQAKDFRRKLAKLLTQSQERALDATCLPNDNVTIDDEDQTTCAENPQMVESAAAEPIRRKPSTRPKLAPTKRGPVLALIAACVVLLTFLALKFKGQLFRSKSGFRMPSKLVIHQSRGRATLDFESLGDAKFAEFRPIKETQNLRTIVLEEDTSIEGLKPGKRYQLRFRSKSGCLSRSLTLNSAYSCLAYKGVETAEKYDGFARLNFKTSRKMKFKAKIKRGESETTVPFESTDGLEHSLPYKPSLGPIDSLLLQRLEPNSKNVALPSGLMVKDALNTISDLEVPLLLQSLKEKMKRVATSINDSDKRHQEQLRLLNSMKKWPKLHALSVFIPLLLKDEALSKKRRLSLAKTLLPLTDIDAFGEDSRAGLALKVDDLVSHYFALKRGKPPEDSQIVPIKNYYPVPLMLMPPTLQQSRERGATLASMKIIHPEVAAPLLRETINFDMPAEKLRYAEQVELVVAAHIFFPCYVLQMRINDKLTIPLRHPWGRFCAERLDEPKKEVIAVVYRRRTIPSSYFKAGSNRLMITATSPFDKYGGQLPVIREVYLNVGPK